MRRKMSAMFIAFLIAICILLSNFNLVFALEPPAYFYADSVNMLVNWIKRSDDSLYESFLNNARQYENMLVMQAKNEYRLTEIRVDNYKNDEMIYIFDENNNRLLFHIYLPDEEWEPTDLDNLISQKNEEYNLMYEGLQYNVETVSINGKENKIYYVNGGKYSSKDSGEKESKQLHALFDFDGYIVSIMGGRDMNQAAWDNAYLDLFEFKYINIQDTGKNPGDANIDGGIDAEDALYVLKHTAKMLSMTEEESFSADVNGDNEMDSADALLILKYSAKIIDKFPVDDFDGDIIEETPGNLETPTPTFLRMSF